MQTYTGIGILPIPTSSKQTHGLYFGQNVSLLGLSVSSPDSHRSNHDILYLVRQFINLTSSL